MVRIIEGTIIFFIIAFLCFGTIIYFVPKLVDLNDYKKEISAFVQEQTGRELTIDGEIKLSLFPWIGADIGKISLSNGEGFGKESFIELERAEVAIKLMPLLKKALEVETITVKGLNVNLIKDASGATNWEDLLGTKQAKKAQDTDKDSQITEVEGITALPLSAFTAGGVIVEDSNLTWRDETSGLTASIKNISLETGSVSTGRPIDIAVSFDLTSNKPDINGFISLKTQVSLKENFALEKLTGTQVQSNITFRDSEIGQIVTLKNFDFKAGPIVIGAPIDINVAFYLENNKPEVKGNISLQTNLFFNKTFSLIKLTKTDFKSKLEGGAIPSGKISLGFKGDAVTNIKEQTFSLDPMLLSVYNVTANGAINGTRIIDSPLIKGKVTIEQFNPKALMNSMAIAIPQTSVSEALTKLGAIVNFTATKNSLTIPSLWVKLDKTTLTGKAAVQNFTKPAVTYDMKLDKINIDEYLPPEALQSPKETKKETTPQKATKQKIELPLKQIRALNIAGTFKANAVTVKKVDISKVLVTLKAKNGVINLKPMKLNVFQGSYDGNIQFDARKDIPTTSVKTTVKNINIGQALKDLANKNIITGTGLTRSSITFKGIEPDLIKQTLNGKAQFTFKDGQIIGFNIPGMIRNAKTTIALASGNVIGALEGLLSGNLNKAKTKKKENEIEPMDFSEITGSVTIKNGFFINKDLRMKSPLIRVNGAGTTSLPKETINYLVKVKIVGSLEGQGGKDDLDGVTIPIKLFGSYSKPDWSVDTKSIQNLFMKKTTKTQQQKQSPINKPLKKVVPKELQQILKQTPLGNFF